MHLNGVLSAPLVLVETTCPLDRGLNAKPDPNALPEGWKAIPHGQGSPSSLINGWAELLRGPQQPRGGSAAPRWTGLRGATLI